MKLFKLLVVLVFFLFDLQAQEDAKSTPKAIDSLSYQKSHNDFSNKDQYLLFGFHLLEQSSLTNEGIPLITWYARTNSTIDISYGDFNSNFLDEDIYSKLIYNQTYPHTKIVYRPTFNEGQRVNFIHKRRYNNGALEIDYDRLTSLGYMFHEKNKYTKFKFRGTYNHPKISYHSDWRIRTLKNDSEWNGGISNDSLFSSGEESNWELLPVYWPNLKTLTKHKDLTWRHHYQLSDSSKLTYTLNLAQDSMFYEGLQDDVMFYPERLDSMSDAMVTALNNKHTFSWYQELKKSKSLNISLSHQTFSVNNLKQKQLLGSATLNSDDLKNMFHVTYELSAEEDRVFVTFFEQSVYLFGLDHRIKFAYEKKNHSWILQNANNLYHPVSTSGVSNSFNKSVEQSVSWRMDLGKHASFVQSYSNIENYQYFNDESISSVLNDLQFYQARFKHKLAIKNWHLNGDVVFQTSSNIAMPVAKLLLNQKLYWQGNLFKGATQVQIGVNILFRSSHAGMGYSPLLGSVYIDPNLMTKASQKLDVFINFKINTVKVFMCYEHLNSLWDGNQYLLKPYPLYQGQFRMSLIWNFYD